jgi:hypothetical protein
VLSPRQLHYFWDAKRSGKSCLARVKRISVAPFENIEDWLPSSTKVASASGRRFWVPDLCRDIDLAGTSVALARMSDAEDYRAKAAGCERMARRTRDPKIKRQLEYLAFEWRQMAEQADKYGW